MEKLKPGKYKGGRPKADFRSASKDNFKKFLLENPSVKITFKQFEEVIREINHQYVLHCLETGNPVKLPYGLGVLAINRKKSRKVFVDNEGKRHICLAINWAETHKEGKKVYHFNDHTDGYNCTWYWMKSLSRIKLSAIWHFKIAKANSLLLRDYCFNGEQKYYLRYHEYNLRKRSFK